MNKPTFLNKLLTKTFYTKRRILLGLLAAVLIAGGIAFYNIWLSRTYIAFINYQPIALQGISQANDNGFIRLFSVSEKDIDKSLEKYDIIFINGMGLRIDAAQREIIQNLANAGKPIYTSMATNPDNAISNFTVDETVLIQQWMSSGGKKNYRSLLAFLRRNVDGKILFSGTPEPAEQSLADCYYYPSNGDEEHEFVTLADYEAFLKAQGLYVEGGQRILVTGQITDPSDLILALAKEKRYNIYPVTTFVKLKDFVEEVQPDAVINLAHGRLGDDMVNLFKERNILLFDPLTINDQVANWEADQMGMMGGFLSQSVIMPEIDGAIRTSVVFAQEKDKNGMLRAYAVPERLTTYVATINKYMDLRSKPNSEKRLAIVYFKGPGQAALVASGMDVVPSLYNLLLNLKAQGYNLSGLPATVDDFAAEIKRRGSLFNAFAAGDAERFMKNGQPQLVSADDYASWTALSLRKDKAAEVDKVFGAFPGTDNLLTTADGRLAFPRLQYGNVVLMPQPVAGAGKDDFQVVHGTDQVPPHSYIAPYLWAQHGFKADALIHFGTHGSLEFTPRKQVALSNNDWPDRLVGALPHFYVYTIDNVGEGMTAKRRAYAQIVSYLTPPYHESNLHGTYDLLVKALREYGSSEGNRTKVAEQIKGYVQELGLDRDLKIDAKKALTEADIEKVESYAQELVGEKVTGTPYTMGVAYAEADIRTSVFAMTTDPIAYSCYNLDRLLGRASADLERNKLKFEDKYIAPAKATVATLYGGANVTDQQICAIASISQEQLAQARAYIAEQNAPKGMLAMMMAAARKDSTATDSKAADSKIADSKAGKAETAGKADKAGNVDKASGHPGKGGSKGGSQSKGGSAKESAKGGSMMSIMMGGDKKFDIPEAKNGPMAKFMRLQMRKMMAKKDPTMMLQVAKKMGASDEALKKMEAAMAKMTGAADDDNKDKATAHAAKGNGSQAGKPSEVDGHTAATAVKPSNEKELWLAIDQIETALKNVNTYRQQLQNSPAAELASLNNALAGGFTAPSPGGDPIANPNTLPTGRNLYAVNTEATPTADAWEKGVALTKATLKDYQAQHNGEYPRKVSYTLWSGEFIQTGGATIAQVLYMLGVEPVRDSYGRVTDLRLIPEEQLGRPRIDIVVQTSGQLRDLAASRLFLISKAVRMAAEAPKGKYGNMVKEGVDESERYLVDKGVSPKEARQLAEHRVFGGLNGGYGSGIQSMVDRGDLWDDDSEVAERYIDNMGAYYGDEDNWEGYAKDAFAAALTRTDVVVQPRQNNSWGALSLDHVYEFMGGMNLAVRNVTGKDPEAYFSDYRNRNNYRVQDSKAAIGVEARTKLFNPEYIKEQLRGGATSTDGLAEMVRNTYGWNVMKPKAIDNEMWDEIYEVYVEDKHNLNVHNEMGRTNPAAMMEMTSTMMETARKGYWKATPEQLARVAELHTDFVKRYGPSGSSFEGANKKLQDFIADNAPSADDYKQSLAQMTQTSDSKDAKAMVMEKQTQQMDEGTSSVLNGVVVTIVVLAVFAALVVLVRRRRKNQA